MEDLIQIARMRCNNINNINKEAPITFLDEFKSYNPKTIHINF